MLSDAERQEIEAEMPHYEDTRALSVDALKVVQRHRGWVDDQALADCAEILGLSVHELEGVATFYNLIFRKPVGRHVILVCDSISCWVCGYETLRERLCRHLDVPLGGTTDDGRFTLLPVNCLGNCDRAPTLMVDDELYDDVSPDQVERLLKEHADA